MVVRVSIEYFFNCLERQFLLVQVGVFSDHVLRPVHRVVTILPLKPPLHDMVPSSLKS
jgi:hypothetical protein